MFIKKHTSTPKDVFLRLFYFLTFYLLVTSFITLFIQYINILVPDALNYYIYNLSNSVRMSSAIIIIATPAYLISAWFLENDIKKTPEKRNLKIVKWLIYLTLFISAITIVIDLITFVYNFLNGELSTQFFLKIMVVLIIAISVFTYFIWELKRTDTKSNTPKILAWTLSIFALISITSGFFIVGTPGQERARRFDEQRINSLQMIQNEIINYWINKEALPEDLNSLKNNISGFITPTDPESNTAFEYRILSPLSFELCANFKSNSDDINYASEKIYYPQNYYQEIWTHKSEKTCFKKLIDPEIYKAKSVTP